jgi:hypothetical protein
MDDQELAVAGIPEQQEIEKKPAEKFRRYYVLLSGVHG